MTHSPNRVDAWIERRRNGRYRARVRYSGRTHGATFDRYADAQSWRDDKVRELTGGYSTTAGPVAPPSSASPPAEPAEPAVSPERDRLRQRVRELERDTAATRELAAAIRRAAECARPALSTPTVKVIRRDDRPLHDEPVDIILHVSDVHFGEVVHSDDVPGGAYSPEVFANERLPRWLDAGLDILEATALQHPIGTVWIAFGGDFVEGDKVFAGQEWHMALDAGAQVATVAPLLADAVSTIAYTAKDLGARRVAVPCVVGNHGVPHGRKSGAVPPSLNYDYLTYELVRHILAGKPAGGGVDWFESKARRAIYFVAAGHVVLLTHGDQDRGGGIVGFAAVTGVRNDLSVRQQTGLNHRYSLVGHYHRPASITVGGDSQKLWNGDWAGANNLSVGRGGGSEPTQRAYVMHPRHGIITEWPIRLAPGMSRAPIDVLDFGEAD